MHFYKLSSLIVLFFSSLMAVEFDTLKDSSIAAFVSNCPDSEKPARINPEDLYKLFMVVMGDRDISDNRNSYHYHQVEEIPRHPDFNITKKTFLYVGGYWDSTMWGFGRRLGKQYKKLGYNVLLLDTLFFTTTSFPEASRLMREVGKHAAEMLATLTLLGLDPKTLEIAGLSLGGETMSFIAKNYRQITGQNVSMLIGMDVSGPCFRNHGPDQRLDPSDADFVLAIITNADGFGIGVPVGTATFYVNGGEWQQAEITWLPCDVMCSHMRAYYLWLSALKNPGGFIAAKCESVEQARNGDCFNKPVETNTMDLDIDRSKPGIYYLATSNRYPYFLGKRGLKVWVPSEIYKF